MKTIESRSNPTITHVASLHLKKYRVQHQQFIAEGIRTCSTLIQHGHTPLALYTTQDQLQQAQALIHGKLPLLLTLVTNPVMDKISATTTPSGLLGVFQIPEVPLPEKLGSGLVLVNLSDPGNMGTLIRTAAALNSRSVVVIEGTDPWSPKVVQACAGTIGMVTIFEWTWQQLIKHKGNKLLCALVVSGGSHPNSIPHDNFLLAVGSEAHGIPQEWLKTCDKHITISMPGKTESLNAAIAGSIALYLATQHSV